MKSSAMNYPNTFGQDCSSNMSIYIWDACNAVEELIGMEQ